MRWFTLLRASPKVTLLADGAVNAGAVVVGKTPSRI